MSDRRLLQALVLDAGAPESSLPAVYGVIDKRGREPAEISREKMEKAAGSAEIASRIEAFLGIADFKELASKYSHNAAVTQHIDRISTYFNYLDALGFGDWVNLDLSIVRGLAYYTGIVFELFDTAGEYRAICGGGRYDTLLETLGGVDLPALGFGMGDVVIGELLRGRGLIPETPSRTDYWVAGEDDALTAQVMSVAAALRKRDKSVEYSLKPQQLSRQLKSAVTAGASHAVLIKHDGFAAGEVTVRDLQAGTERAVSLDEFINSL